MKPIVYFLTILAVAGLLISMQQLKTPAVAESSVSAPEIKPLLKKHDLIGSGLEMEQILTKFDEASNQLAADPENNGALLDIAEIYMTEARLTGEHGYYFPSALSLTRYVLANDPGADSDFRARAMEASVLLSLHEFNDAFDAATKAVKKYPQNAFVRGTMVDACTELGKYADAVAHCDTMLSIRPDLRSYSRASYLRQLHDDLSGAIEAMEMAVDAGYPGMESTEWCRIELSKLYEENGALDKARLAAEEALAYRPSYPFATERLAELTMATGNLDEAEKLYLSAAAIIPEVSFYEGLARINFQRGDMEGGKKLVAEVIEMMQDDIAHGHNMDIDIAKVYLELDNNPTEARKYAMQAFEVRPDNKEVLSVLNKINEVGKKL